MITASRPIIACCALFALAGCKDVKLGVGGFGGSGVDGVFLCSRQYDPARTCGGTAYYLCNNRDKSVTVTVTRTPAWHSEPEYKSDVTAPAHAKLSDRTAPLVGLTEFGNRNNLCEPLNYTIKEI